MADPDARPSDEARPSDQDRPSDEARPSGTGPAPEPVRGAGGGPVAPAALRASDADRERVAEVVRAAAVEGRLELDELDGRLAAVFAARTYGQLARVTADLPDTADGSPAAGDRLSARAPARTAPAVPGDGPRSGAVVAVLSGSRRSGRWTVPEHLTAVAVLGAVELDLTGAVFAADRVTVTVAAVLGSVEIRVPEGVAVHGDGIGLLGTFDTGVAGTVDTGRVDTGVPGTVGRSAVEPAGGAGPVLVVRGVAVCGSVEVKREQRRPRRAELRGPEAPGASGGAPGRDDRSG